MAVLKVCCSVVCLVLTKVERKAGLMVDCWDEMWVVL